METQWIRISQQYPKADQDKISEALANGWKIESYTTIGDQDVMYLLTRMKI